MITVKGTCIIAADEKTGIVNISKRYLYNEGLELVEEQNIARESDYTNEKRRRVSHDNGRTFGEWEPVEATDLSKYYGSDEIIYADTPRRFNPVHSHYVYTHWSRYFVGGHKDAYKKYWGEAKKSFYDHQYISVAKDGTSEPLTTKLVRYEEGHDFSEENPSDPEFLKKNMGYINEPSVLSSGDIAVPVGVPDDKLCELFGLDVNEIFPTCPEIHLGVMIARGKFDKEKGEYDFTFSNPVILDDLRSSRGIDEPIVTELTSGRLILVMRGSNVRSANWRTRIKEGTPTYKWFAYSDDGGKTFSPAEPWSFDSGEPMPQPSLNSFARPKTASFIG